MRTVVLLVFSHRADIFLVNSYLDLAAVTISMANKSVSNPVRSRPQNLEIVGSISVIPHEVISALSIRATTAGTLTLSNTVRSIHHHLCAMILEGFDGEPTAVHKDTSGLTKMNGNVQHLSLAVFLLSNDLVTTEKLAELIGLFVDASGVQLLRSLLAIQTPTIEALAEKLVLGPIQSGIKIVVQMCHEARASPNVTLLGPTALQYVAEKANIELTRILIEAGAEVNTPPSEYCDRTALQAAVVSSNIELVQILLEAKADVHAPPADYCGMTALQAAAEGGKIGLVQYLLTARANVNAPATRYAGATALQVAAIHEYVIIATVPLNAGADANADGALEEGRTALEGAAEHGRIDMVQLLLNAGVDLRKQGNTQYKRTLQLASENEYRALERLVEAHYKSSCTDDQLYAL